MEDLIYEIEERIKELNSVFDTMYLPNDIYLESDSRVYELKWVLRKLENIHNTK